MVKLMKGLLEYDSENRNGYTTLQRAGDPSGKSMKFEKVPDVSMVKLDGAFAGMQVDVYDKST